mmetsp:Transcript_15623/g.20568  ORF Transcript_15623/g.20568 Transcript_15623/m.20568 type:complete len:361 (-) Transcript_15623:173-1255(-)
MGDCSAASWTGVSSSRNVAAAVGNCTLQPRPKPCHVDGERVYENGADSIASSGLFRSQSVNVTGVVSSQRKHQLTRSQSVSYECISKDDSVANEANELKLSLKEEETSSISNSAHILFAREVVRVLWKQFWVSNFGWIFRWQASVVGPFLVYPLNLLRKRISFMFIRAAIANVRDCYQRLGSSLFRQWSFLLSYSRLLLAEKQGEYDADYDSDFELEYSDSSEYDSEIEGSEYESDGYDEYRDDVYAEDAEEYYEESEESEAIFTDQDPDEETMIQYAEKAVEALEPLKLVQISPYPCSAFDSDSHTKAAHNVSCTICLEAWECGESARELQCGHRYHPLCIFRWAALGKLTCPICRATI